jgi:CheY-like chemotaxis protein
MTPAPETTEARKWVLVVDDDPTVRTLLVDILQEAGYRVVGAEDGYVAEDLIRDLFPDLILLDLHMPRGSGFSLLNNMRKHPRWQAIPIVIVSGYLDQVKLLDEAGLTVVGRIGKPVDIDRLLALVRETLGR